jgi:hypothetical protein
VDEMLEHKECKWCARMVPLSKLTVFFQETGYKIACVYCEGECSPVERLQREEDRKKEEKKEYDIPEWLIGM